MVYVIQVCRQLSSRSICSCEISASSWFYYKEICYDARSHGRNIMDLVLSSTASVGTVEDFCSVSEVNTIQTEAELCRQPRGGWGEGGGDQQI